MIRRLTCLILLLGASLASSLAADRPAISDSDASTRQVLVMLHLPAPHFRPDMSYSGGYADDATRGSRRRIAQALAHAHSLTLAGEWPMPALGIDCYVMEVPATESPAHIAEILSQDSRVEWAQPMNMFHGLGGGDPLYPVQPDAKYWHLAEIHHLATGRSMTVAVIDSGVDERHPDLTGQIALKENFVDGNAYAGEAHGTGVAGIIAARADNGAGIEGVAPNARLMALRACWQSPDQVTRCSSFTLGKALNFAIEHDAQIINLSLTGPSDRLLQRLLDAALERGITVVGAFDPQQPAGGFPASHPGVVAVAEQEETQRVPEGVFTAPGRDIPTTAVGKRWNFVSGSSYAAAHVSGLAALLGELQPHARTSALLHTMSAGGVMEPVGMRSGGRINACAVIAQAAAACACSCTTPGKAPDYR